MYHWNLRKSQPIVGAYQARAGGARCNAVQYSTVRTRLRYLQDYEEHCTVRTNVY